MSPGTRANPAPPRASRGAARLPLLLLLLAGCATVRSARRAQDPATALPGERTPTTTELGLARDGLLPLDAALRVALRVHPTAVRARRDAQAAEARTREIEGAFLPSVGVDASASYREAKATGSAQEHHFQSLGFQVSWLLFDFGRTPALARQAAEQWLAAQADARAAELDVAFGVRSAYAALRKDRELADVAREALAQFQAHLDQVREFVRVGTRIPYDETKAEVDVGGARLALVQADDAVLSAQAELANALGLAETTDWRPEDAAPELAAPPDFDACWTAARGSRPDLASSAARVAAASALVDARVAALYPSFDLSVGLSFAGARFPLPWSASVGPGAAWTPFDGFTNLYSIDESVAALRSARAVHAAAEQKAWLEVRAAWLALQDARQRLELTGLSVRNAQQNLTLAEGLFEVGRATTIELTDARQALTKARSDDVQARADLELAAATLRRALGTPEPLAPRPTEPGADDAPHETKP